MTVLDALNTPTAALVGWALVHFLWQGALIHLALVLTLRVVPKPASELRYVFSCSALLLMVLLPALTVTLMAHDPATDAIPQPSGVQAQIVSASGNAIPPTSSGYVADSAAIPNALMAVEPADPGSLDTAPLRLERILRPWIRWLVAVWLIGAILFLVRLLGGLAYAGRLRQRGVSGAPAKVQESCELLRELLGVRTLVDVLCSRLVRIPMVMGIVQPVILLPTSAVSKLTGRQVELMLIHELVHVRRRDLSAALVQSVVEALLFFHPSVWSVSRTIRREREYCCDAAVLKWRRDRSLYASTLAGLEGMRSDMGALLTANGGFLADRIRRILYWSEVQVPLVAPRAAGTGLLTLALCGSMLVSQLSPDVTAPSLPNLERISLLSAEELSRLLAEMPEYAGVLTATWLGRSGSHADGSLGSQPRTVTVTPSVQPNFVDVEAAVAPPLPVGFNLASAGLEVAAGHSFPDGRQFVVVRSYPLPEVGEGYAGMLDGIDLDRYRVMPEGIPEERFHVLVSRSNGFEVPRAGDAVTAFGMAELSSHPDYAIRLVGPWSLWFDANNIVRNASQRQMLLAGGAVAIVRRTEQYLCVEDGQVVASRADYLIAASQDVLRQMVSDCLARELSPDGLVGSLQTGSPAPAFSLIDESGTRLENLDLLGQPYLLFVPAPVADMPVELPAEHIFARTLEPGPASRLAQVRALLAEHSLDLRIIPVALPYAVGAVEMHAWQVAEVLRSELDVPVYEDAGGSFAVSYSELLLQAPSSLVLIGGDGRVLGGFMDRPPDPILSYLPAMSSALARLPAGSGF